jgi:hypothetical protein
MAMLFRLSRGSRVGTIRAYASAVQKQSISMTRSYEEMLQADPRHMCGNACQAQFVAMQRDVSTLVRVRGALPARHAAVSSVAQAAEVVAAGDGWTCSSTTPAWALGQRLCASLVAVFAAGLKRRAASVDDDGAMAAAPKRVRRDRHHEAEVRAAAASGAPEEEVEEQEEDTQVCVCV